MTSIIKKDVTPQMSLEKVLWQAFKHFYHLDLSNAAFHTAVVRYSPITFRLAEHLWVMGEGNMEVAMVIGDQGRYEEDHGRV